MTYSVGQIWVIILALALGTYLIRLSFLGLVGRRPLPPAVLRLLRYTPVAVLPGMVAPLVDQKIEDFDRVMAVNVRGAFLGLQHVLPVMTGQQSGSVINMSSIAGLKGSPNVAPYITSKHAVVGLTRAAAIEVAGHNVRVNSVHPSPVNTRMMRSLEEGFNPGHGDEVKQQLAGTIPLGRYGESIEIANLVLFLASDESAFITGAQYPIDGGMSAG